MTARAAFHAISRCDRPRCIRARRRGPAAAASPSSSAGRANAARRRRRATARAKAARASAKPPTSQRKNDRFGRFDLARRTSGRLAAHFLRESNRHGSDDKHARDEHGPQRGACATGIRPRRDERRRPAELAARAERRRAARRPRGGSSADHTDANVASGPASSANVPAASRYGAPPRAATRRCSCGNASVSSSCCAAQRLPTARRASSAPRAGRRRRGSLANSRPSNDSA